MAKKSLRSLGLAAFASLALFAASDAHAAVYNISLDGSSAEITGSTLATTNPVYDIVSGTATGIFSTDTSVLFSAPIFAAANSGGNNVTTFGFLTGFPASGSTISGSYAFAPVVGNASAGTLTVASVPEASTWAMMLVGFGLVGFGMRKRKTVASSGFNLAIA